MNWGIFLTFWPVFSRLLSTVITRERSSVTAGQAWRSAPVTGSGKSSSEQWSTSGTLSEDSDELTIPCDFFKSSIAQWRYYLEWRLFHKLTSPCDFSKSSAQWGNYTEWRLSWAYKSLWFPLKSQVPHPNFFSLSELLWLPVVLSSRATQVLQLW